MGRIRTIKPEFPQSESMGRVSRDARLLFLLLLTLADDSGRLRGSSRILASLLYPYDDDAKGLIDGWLDELDREECVVRYMVGKDTYLQITNWSKHQKIDKPSVSKNPPFEESSRILGESSRILAVGSRIKDQGSGTKDQGGDQGLKSPSEPSCSVPPSVVPRLSSPANEKKIDDSPVLAIVPCVGKGEKEWLLRESKVKEWAEAYPGVDVMPECRKAIQWLRDNPTRQKTFTGLPAFFSKWLARGQNLSTPKGAHNEANPHHRRSAIDAAYDPNTNPRNAGPPPPRSGSPTFLEGLDGGLG